MSSTSFRFLPSPFFDHRPPGTVIDLLVIHAISLPPGCFGGTDIDDLFLGQLKPKNRGSEEEDSFYKEIAALQVSTHFLIDRLGKVTQYVPVLCRAWHAGKSVWQGRQPCNPFSIGVELEGDAQTPFEPIQYQQLVNLVPMLQKGLVQRGQAGFTHQNITGHQHIAPGRKWDPGPFFDWQHFQALLSQNSQNSQNRPVSPWPLVWE